MTKKELKFWAAVVALNMIIFLPWYLLSYTQSDFFPYKGLIEGAVFDRFKSFFVRHNYDPFRLSIDILLICVFVYNFRFHPRVKYIIKLALYYYLVIVLYQVYNAFFNLIYQTPPVFYNDLPFLENGLKIFINDFDWLSLLGLAFLMVIIYASSSLFNYMTRLLQNVRMGMHSRAIFGILLIVIVTGLIRYGMQVNPAYGVQFVAGSIWKNTRESLVVNKMVNEINYEEFSRQSVQYGFNIDKYKPNIIVIFIESYGKLVLDQPYLSVEYKKKLLEKQKSISTSGYHGVSALSQAPVAGGGSWLSYTTFGIGYRLQSQSLFFSFLKNEKFRKYTHLYKWLDNQGYINYRLNPQYDNNKFTIPWDLYTSFFSVDEWIRLKDLNYKGILYGFGPSPPDQYSLNYALKLAESNQKGPFSLFFISKNSHTPFFKPYEIKADWSIWNDIEGPDQPGRFFRKPTLENYLKAIMYQLDYIFQIIEDGGENDLYIIVGDHQPPALDAQGFETPIHIISKDSTFIKGFENYGFTSGLLPDKNRISLKHEGLYTMLLRELKRNYSSDSILLPDYLPNGIIFGRDQDTK